MSSGQVQTILYVVGATVVYIVALLAIETWKYLKDPDAIITNSLRTLMRRLPWPVVLLGIVFGFMAGHCFGQ